MSAGLGRIALAVLVVLLLRGGRDRMAGGVWLALTVLMAAPVGRVGWPELDPDGPGLVFLDVGQGDAALVLGGDGVLMIDAGGGRPGPTLGRSVERAVRALGIDRVDVLAVTHGDFDHRGGADRLVAGGRVGVLWLPAAARVDPAMQRLAERARAHAVAVEWLAAGMRRRIGGDIGVDVLWPPLARGRPEDRRNDTSLVMRVASRGVVSLWTGDVGAEVESVLVDRVSSLRADVLKVGHHGSARSSRIEFLDRVRPRLAVLSAPCLATRGLPSAEVHARLAEYADAVAWTGRDGAVGVARDSRSGRIRWSGLGQSRPCPGPRASPNAATRSN